MIIVLNTINLDVQAFGTMQIAGKNFGLSSYQVSNRIKSGKILNKEFKFMQVDLIKDRNKSRK
jgi:hypothetical protein